MAGITEAGEQGGAGARGAAATVEVRMRINGHAVTMSVPGGERLLDTIRERLRLTGTKEGCGVGECGACTVIVNGQAVNSCLVLTAQCDGAEIVTVEGLTGDGEMHALQRAFIEHGAVQCGFCTPGMLMSAKALLDADPHPDRHKIRQAIAGNLCRCTGYEQIVQAIESVARQAGSKDHGEGGCEADGGQGS
ncbi:MAG: Nicotinate dehydrogenase small FeS subunit [Firmicutes bacterium ADurb.BinA052]|nr:MAG: Nicotinate dehydrogenase small FeS subunit [Firmicutes bacterium ADurb.BinA052]